MWSLSELQARFPQALAEVTCPFSERDTAGKAAENPSYSGIGTLGERTLHAVLKRCFEPYTPSHEQKIGEFVADIVGPSGIIEIQTGNLGKLRRKLAVFLEYAPVLVVFPISRICTIFWREEDGSISSPRRSPKRGTFHNAYPEICQLKEYINHPNFQLCLLLVDVEEYRKRGGRRWKNSHTRLDRIPSSLADAHWFNDAKDYLWLLGQTPFPMTAKDFAENAGIPLDMARYGLYFLRQIGAIRQISCKDKFHLYQQNEAFLSSDSLPFRES